jgi:hypothetical protein
MNTAKWIAAFGLLASGSVVAQETVYDYQGVVMTGLGAPETLTAQLVLFGPVTYPGTVADVSVGFSGTYSGSIVNTTCIIGFCATPGVPLELQVNETHGQFVSAYINFSNIFSDQGVFYESNFDIGPKGDSLELATLFGPNVVNVSNSTPGIWTEARAVAPELNADGTLCAITLLAGSLLLWTASRQPPAASRQPPAATRRQTHSAPQRYRSH